MAAAEWSTRSLEARARRMERVIGWVRLLVVPGVLLAFFIWPDRSGQQTLAVTIKAAALDAPYALAVLALRPWRSPRIRIWGAGTAVYDFVSLLTFVFITGGANSPFLPVLIPVVAASAMRFGAVGVVASGFALTAPLLAGLAVDPGSADSRFALLVSLSSMWFVGIGITALRREEDRQHEANLSLALEAARSGAELELATWRANTDGLTGLSNHSCFHTLLTEALRRRRPAAIVYADLDGFKQVNDRLGHLVGDGVLQTFAKEMRAITPNGVTTARLGGDEFAALLLDEQALECEGLARRVRAITVPTSAGDVRASVGVATSDDGVTPEGVMAQADQAMYAEKHRRRQERAAA